MNRVKLSFDVQPVPSEIAKTDLYRGVYYIGWRVGQVLGQSVTDEWFFCEVHSGVMRIVFHRGTKYSIDIDWLEPVTNESYLNGLVERLIAEWNSRSH